MTPLRCLPRSPPGQPRVMPERSRDEPGEPGFQTAVENGKPEAPCLGMTTHRIASRVSSLALPGVRNRWTATPFSRHGPRLFTGQPGSVLRSRFCQCESPGLKRTPGPALLRRWWACAHYEHARPGSSWTALGSSPIIGRGASGSCSQGKVETGELKGPTRSRFFGIVVQFGVCRVCGCCCAGKASNDGC